MKHLKLKKVWEKIKGYLPIIIILAVAIFLRFYRIESRAQFDADQEEIAFRAKELLSGNPVLLGPKTSLGGFSIGPSFTYLWALISLFTKGDPVAGVYASILLGLIFTLSVFLFTRKVYSTLTASILSLTSAVSIGLIIWDQSPWAPSFFYLSEMVILYGVFISDKKSWGILLTALGVAIGFQAHFAVFLLIPPIVIFWLLHKPQMEKRMSLFSLLVIFAGFLSVIVFDVTHGFINFQRLISIFKLAITGAAPPTSKIILTLITNSMNYFYLYFSESTRIALFVIAIFVSALGVMKDAKYKRIIILSLIFLFIPFIFFLFYRSNFSEYYLMTALPPFILISGFIFEKLKKYRNFLYFVVFALTLYNLRAWYAYKRPMSLMAKRELVKTIIQMGGKSGYGVSLSVEAGNQFGYRYLFDFYGAFPDIPPKKNQKKIFTIVVPPGYKGIEAVKQFDGIGLRWEGI